MKNLLILIIIMLVGCATTPATTPAMKSVAGTYENNDESVTILDASFGITYRRVLLENGIVKIYRNGKKKQEDKWSIVDGELHIDYGFREIHVWRINKDKSMTVIAEIADGKRTDIPKEKQITYKRIK